jgi:hypothetical protein
MKLRVFAWFSLCLLSSAAPSSAAGQHTIEIGTGWQNTGATREQTWEPGIQGSRKDVPLFVGWRYALGSRVYYAPFARLQYTNFWSIGGAGNLLGIDLGAGGIGFALSDPIGEVPREQRVGRFFATLEINLANVRIGFNATPGAPESESVPDPEAHRARVRAQVAAGEGADASIQHYPFGEYAYVQIAFPVRISVWGLLSETFGLGFFIESTVAALEWPIGIEVSSPAYTYNVIAGASFHLADAAR